MQAGKEEIPIELTEILEKNKWTFEKFLAKGWSSRIYLVKNKKRKKLVLKVERSDSPRKNMCEREVKNLQLANTVGIGPKLIEWNLEKKIIVMDYIQGKAFSEWMLDQVHTEKEIQEVIEQLLEQGKKLDILGLDHGQLAGRGNNILVKRIGKKWKPVIIDFEKASTQRKTHNLTQLEGFLFKNPKGKIAQKIKEITEKK